MFHPIWLRGSIGKLMWILEGSFSHVIVRFFQSPEEGKIYSLVVNETQLDQPRSYTVQLALRKVSRCLPHLRVACMASNQSSTLYITGKNHLPFAQGPGLGQISQTPAIIIPALWGTPRAS